MNAQVPAQCQWAYDERDVVVGGLRLHLLEAAPTDAEPGADGSPRVLLMLHGMLSHGDAFRTLVRRITVPDRVLCPDFRGHGRSQWTEAGYWLADFARDTLGLLDECGIDRVDVMGHSLGARVAMVLSPMLGPRLRSLILSDTAPEVSREAAEHARDIATSNRRVSAFNDEAALRTFLHDEFPGFTEESIDTKATRLYRRNWVGKLIPLGDPEVTWLLGRAGLREVDDMWAGLAATTAPTLILRGTQSFLLSEELTARMRAALADVTCVEIDTGHYMHYEDPDAVARVLDEFLART